MGCTGLTVFGCLKDLKVSLSTVRSSGASNHGTDFHIPNIWSPAAALSEACCPRLRKCCVSWKRPAFSKGRMLGSPAWVCHGMWSRVLGLLLKNPLANIGPTEV